MKVVAGPPGIDLALVRAAQRGDRIAVADLMDALAGYVDRVCGRVSLHAGRRAGGVDRDLEESPRSA